MPNAVGYNYGEPFERISQQGKERMSSQFNRRAEDAIDVQGDFPFDQRSDTDCMNTIAARIVYKIMVTN